MDPARDGCNWYGYAGGNPITHFDPTGLEFEAIKTLYANISCRGVAVYSESENYLAIIVFTGEQNKKGSMLGQLYLYSPEQFDQNHNLDFNNEPLFIAPIISGANYVDREGKVIHHDRIADGIYINAYMRQPNSELLKDKNHSKQTILEDGTIEYSPIWDIPNSDNRVVHQGNNLVTQDGGFTEGCPAITGQNLQEKNARNNYQAFIDCMNGNNLNILVLDNSKGYVNSYQGVTYYEK